MYMNLAILDVSSVSRPGRYIRMTNRLHRNRTRGSDPALGEHLFRRESGRMIAALTRIFGVHNLALAEDVVQDAFCRALEVWKARGLPENPSAWLMATAKNRALDVLRRERTARTFAPEMGRLLETEWTIAPVVAEAFAEHTIRDEQLRMMFSCADPRLPEEVQVALILNILCGFGAGEIASAFLAGRAAVEKRISRGKKVLATSRTLFDLEDTDFASRIATVRRALYLLFARAITVRRPSRRCGRNCAPRRCA
jgi:RNA polymerase sigma factor (sigma-70 family)